MVVEPFGGRSAGGGGEPQDVPGDRRQLGAEPTVDRNGTGGGGAGANAIRLRLGHPGVVRGSGGAGGPGWPQRRGALARQVAYLTVRPCCVAHTRPSGSPGALPKADWPGAALPVGSADASNEKRVAPTAALRAKRLELTFDLRARWGPWALTVSVNI